MTDKIFSGGFLLSEGVIDVTSILFTTAESAFATERHQLVGRVRVLHISIVRVVEHVARFLSRKRSKFGSSG